MKWYQRPWTSLALSGIDCLDFHSCRDTSSFLYPYISLNWFNSPLAPSSLLTPCLAIVVDCLNSSLGG